LLVAAAAVEGRVGVSIDGEEDAEDAGDSGVAASSSSPSVARAFDGAMVVEQSGERGEELR
jgi:hypothetical protein